MASPNMLQLNSITGSNSNVSLTTTNPTQLISNAAASSTVLKVNAVYAANTDSVARNITLNYYSAAALGGTAFPIVSTLSVPASSSVTIVDKDAHLYLTENTSLGATAGTATTIVMTVTYEICA